MTDLRWRLREFWGTNTCTLPCEHPAIGGHDMRVWGDVLVIYAECRRCGV